MAEIKPINLKATLNIETTPADLVNWDAQNVMLMNTGIERDGGVTNLFTKVESNSLYEKTFYTRNNKRVRLLNDDINDAYHVYTNDIEIGIVPRWAVESRALLSIDANDIMATMDGTFLILRIASSIATIQEVDESSNILRTRSFAIPSTISDGFLVRNKAPTWANVTSIAGVYANGVKLNCNIINDAGTVYAIGSQIGFVNSSQVFAYYESGWIVSANDKTDGRTFLLNSAGVQQGTYTEATFLTVNNVAGVITFQGYRDVVALGTPATYGNAFTPPAAPLGVWTITALTNTVTTPVAQYFTFGGYEMCHTLVTRNVFYANNTATPRSWTIGHATPSEIYGYLDRGADIAFKVHTILGDAAYLSASFNADGIGVPIVEIGELNSSYLPQILKATDGAYRVLYRRGNGSYATVKMSKATTIDRMQEIAPGVVKINTISALCIADANDNDLQYGGNAYNGFVILGFDAVNPVQKAFVARYRGEWGGSVDTNYKSTGAVLVGTPNLIVIPESVSFTPNNETIDVYYGPPPSSLAYYRSIKDGFAQTVKSNLLVTLYVDDLVVPPPEGATYFDQTVSLIGSTAIREQNYDGYALLNEVQGHYISFTLYGNLYLFDGDWIYLASLSANTLQSRNRVANALGLTFLAESPTSIFFLSAFDNAVFTFDGGQAVVKQNRFNQKGTIRGGTYSPFENTLALFLDNSVIFIRDGVMTETFLSITYPYDAYQTSDGIWITQNRFAVKYVYRDTGTGGAIVIALDLDGGIWGTAYTDDYDGGVWGTPYADTIEGAPWGDVIGNVEPLVWESAFLGFSDKVKQSIDRYTFRVYKQDKAVANIAIAFRSYKEDGIITQAETYVIGDVTNPYDADGYAFIDFLPAHKNTIASSIKLTCPEKIVLVDGYATVTGSGESNVKNRS